MCGSPRAEDRPQEQDDSGEEEDERKRASYEGEDRASALHQSGAEAFFGERGEDEPDGKVGERDPKPVEEESDPTEGKHDPDIEHAIGERVGSDDGENDDGGEENPFRNRCEAGEPWGGGEHDRGHDDIGDEVRSRDRVDGSRVVFEEQRAGLEAVEDEGTEEDGVDDTAGNPETDEGDKGTADGGIVGRLRGDDADERIKF